MKINMGNNDRIVKFVHSRPTTRMNSNRIRTGRVQWPPRDLSIGWGEGSA